MLHIDKNNYYGGTEAALSLQEVESWAESADEGGAILQNEVLGGIDANPAVQTRDHRPSGMPPSETRRPKRLHNLQIKALPNWAILEPTVSR